MFEVHFAGLNVEHPFFGKNCFVVDNCYDPYTRNKIIHYIHENQIKNIYSKDFDLSYLYECPNVEFVVCSTESNHLETLYTLKHLRGLALATDNGSFDFAKLSDKLEYLSTSFECKNKSWMYSSTITQLSLHHYETNDLEWLSKFQNKENLTYFEIASSYGKMKTLNGISQLTNLKHLVLDYCRHLVDITDMYKLKNLEVLRFHDNPRVKDLLLNSFPQMRELYLFDRETTKHRSIDSLQFMQYMPYLEKCWTDYIILDGDLKPLLKLKDAKIFQDRRFYNLKQKNLPHMDS